MQKFHTELRFLEGWCIPGGEGEGRGRGEGEREVPLNVRLLLKVAMVISATCMVTKHLPKYPTVVVQKDQDCSS